MIDEFDATNGSGIRFFTIAEIARQFGVSEKWVGGGSPTGSYQPTKWAA